MTTATPPRIDIHVHLAGVGTNNSGCWISPSFRRRPTFLALRLLHGIGPRALRESADQDWVDGIASRVRASQLDAAVVLGFDGVYDGSGRLDPQRSQMVIPPSWVFESCRRHAGVLLPGPSINPRRADARERLEECIEGGAALMKWLPSTQVIDPADRGHEWFFMRMAEADLPLLVHAGGRETTFRQLQPELKDLWRLEAALELGVRVIVAHQAAPVLLSRDTDQTGLLRRWLERYPNLWVDNSGMANPTRFTYLARHSREDLISSRTLHGSDFPVLVNAIYYPKALGAREMWRLERIRNTLQRDVDLKRALGYPEATFTRAAGVLASVQRWLPAAAVVPRGAPASLDGKERQG